MSIKTKVGLLLAGLGIAGTAGVVGKSMSGGGEATPTPERSPASSAPATPGETQPASTGGFSVEQYKDGEELARAHNTKLNEWIMAGANPKDIETIDWTDYDASLQSILTKYDEQYTEMFVDKWQDNPELVATVDDLSSQHRAVLDAHIKTTDSGEPADVEPYSQETTVTSVTVQESTAQRMVVSYRYEWQSNADQNRGDTFIENIDGVTGGVTVTFTNIDGEWKVSGSTRFAG